MKRTIWYPWFKNKFSGDWKNVQIICAMENLWLPTWKICDLLGIGYYMCNNVVANHMWTEIQHIQFVTNFLVEHTKHKIFVFFKFPFTGLFISRRTLLKYTLYTFSFLAYALAIIHSVITCTAQGQSRKRFFVVWPVCRPISNSSFKENNFSFFWKVSCGTVVGKLEFARAATQ